MFPQGEQSSCTNNIKKRSYRFLYSSSLMAKVRGWLGQYSLDKVLMLQGRRYYNNYFRKYAYDQDLYHIAPRTAVELKG